MWSLSEGSFRKPHMPMFNWEELSKMDPSILRTLRHIHFGKFSPSFDGEYFGKKKKSYGNKKVYLHELDEQYPVLDVKRRWTEEWPSEKFNYQDNLAHLNPNANKKKKSLKAKAPTPTDDESTESVKDEAKITKSELKDFLTSIDGIGKKKVNTIIDHIGSVEDVVGVLHQNPSLLTEVKGITKKLVSKIEKAWENLLK
jgi:hypothetical protein